MSSSMPASEPKAATAFPPAGAQTVGPFFRIGLDYLTSGAEAAPAADEFEVQGRLFDADGKGVADAVLEFWGADASGAYDSGPTLAADGRPRGFVRVSTGPGGEFHLVMRTPGPVVFSGDRMQSPHLVVLVFMRGLLRHLITRLYLPDPAGNAADPVLSLVPAERRETLIARTTSRGAKSFDWDIHMQGAGETVFFAW
jgi:protocatechuate 3,4-dioxygenase, alpha subunit